MLFSSDLSRDLIFVTVVPDIHISDISIGSTFEEFAQFLSKNNVILLQERIYGQREQYHQIFEDQKKIFTKHTIEDDPPITFIEGTPMFQFPVAGIHAIVTRQKDITNIVQNDNKVGRAFTGNEASFCLLSDVGASTPYTHTTRATHTYETLNLTQQLLHNHGWDYKQTCRTWFYLDDILSWYDDFNTSRNSLYQSFGFHDKITTSLIPASTGIEGKNALGHPCTLDLLAAHQKNNQTFKLRRLVNPEQNEAPSYGSAFSRGIALELDSTTYIFVSGTAAIDKYGISLHHGDMEAQIQTTVKNIQALLDGENCSVEDISCSTTFIKSREDTDIYQKTIQQWPTLQKQSIVTLADVCREELLFEIDATVVVSR